MPAIRSNNMANSLSASFAEYWSRRMQRVYYKSKVFKMISNMEEQKLLKNGDKVHRPYRSALTYNAMGSEGSYTRQDITDTDESLTIDQKPETTFYVQEVDEIQSNYKTANEYATDAGDVIGDAIDGDVLGEYDQAASTIANYEITGNGSAGDGIGFTLSTSNIYQVFSQANRKLDQLNIKMENRWAVISPQFRQILWDYIQGKDSTLGDTTGTNGNIGTYGGFNLYLSNNLGGSTRLEFGTNPTANDTVVINGVTITFVATLSAASGATEVHICASAAATLDSLVAFINAPGTSVTEATNAGISSATAAEQVLLKGITATDGTTYMTLKGEGSSYIPVSETLTAAADIWTTTKQLQHCLFGQGNPVDLVLQKYPNLRIKDRDGYIGKDYVTWTLFGLKTFAEGTKQLVDVQLRSDAY